MSLQENEIVVEVKGHIVHQLHSKYHAESSAIM